MERRAALAGHRQMHRPNESFDCSAFLLRSRRQRNDFESRKRLNDLTMNASAR